MDCVRGYFAFGDSLAHFTPSMQLRLCSLPFATKSSRDGPGRQGIYATKERMSSIKMQLSRDGHGLQGIYATLLFVVLAICLRPPRVALLRGNLGTCGAGYQSMRRLHNTGL